MYKKPFTRLHSLVFSLFLNSLLDAEIYHAQGEMAGEPTASSIILQSRLTSLPGPDLDEKGDVPGAPGVACFEWSTSHDFSNSKRTSWLQANPDSDFIVRSKVEGLKSNTLYYYRLVFGADKAKANLGPVRSFKTLPAVDSEASLSFAMGSCQNYAFFMQQEKASDEDKHLGFPVYSAMLARKPDFFIGTGDIVYYDHPVETRAKTLPELRRKWHEQFRFPRLIDFFAVTPAFWSKDDHDFRFDDADLTEKSLPEPDTGISIFREQMPIHPMNESTSLPYRSYRIHKNLQLWFVEGREYRSPNKMPDGSDKTLWGKEQRAWLQASLKQSDATWKIIINPTPMVGPDRASKSDNHTNKKGFRHEADSFFAWLTENKMHNVISFCGDRHWQYHSIHPSGFEEFSCGALNDENAIVGLKPGQKGSTDPSGLIKQPFLYKKTSGGFLSVTVGGNPASLRMAFIDDQGKELYATTKNSN